ncbi:actin-binding protein LAS17 NDAI_0D02710 [Naumovozyma dairenensis CBS 421]|uniref:WH1 domain-containing protein n=1 Tax=Naumovozyma dairenensis (strain ATCC 10597 / BCRC 20456 / CBS 421 / NBRC 0211 / NRRL Y-12639) TaxID=1071378 RepID=G0W9X4_NAUDC|nr:hypothetical protein NDAI_0D02710 [Naumovozyma dairenensis CBS 421]CCD24585.1 hypothetical protein NDAI_0D02710 [Naumovozyma dairenensis CBS 421]
MGVLNSQDKDIIKRALPKSSNKIIDITVARLYIAYPDKSEWKYTGLSGAIALVDDTVGNTFFLKLVDINGHRGVLWDQELYVNFEYYQDRTFFHTFELEECFAGLLFVDIHEAAHFLKRVQKREKYASRKTLMNKNAIALTKKIKKEQASTVVHGPRGEALIGNQRQRYQYQEAEPIPITKNKAPPPPPPSAPTPGESDIEQDEEEEMYTAPTSEWNSGPTTNESTPAAVAPETTAHPKHKVPPLPEQFAHPQGQAPSPPAPGGSNNPFPFPVPAGAPQLSAGSTPFPIPIPQPSVGFFNQQSPPPPPMNNSFYNQQQQQHRPVPQPPSQNGFQNASRPMPLPPRQTGFNHSGPPAPPPRRGPAPPPPPHRHTTTTFQGGIANPIAPNYTASVKMNANGARIVPPPPPARRGPAPPPPPRASRIPQQQGQSPQLQMGYQLPFQNQNTNYTNANANANVNMGIPPLSPPVQQQAYQSNVPSPPLTTFNTQGNQQIPVAPPFPNNNISNVGPGMLPPPTAGMPAPPPPSFLTNATSNAAAPPPPPPAPAIPIASTTEGAGGSSINEATGDPGRDALLASIRGAGGINALKKVDKSQLDKPSVLLQEAKGETPSMNNNGAAPGGPPGGPSGGGAGGSLADALAAALNKRKNKIGGADDDHGDDW